MKPWVALVIGVNGIGKTTTIGKLAARFARGGRATLLVAADTFRAAATEQLEVWAERAGVELRARPGSDPAAVVHDALAAAPARGTEIVLVDTAGRLHTSLNLMEELGQDGARVRAPFPRAPHHVLLVLDATLGQNGLHRRGSSTPRSASRAWPSPSWTGPPAAAWCWPSPTSWGCRSASSGSARGWTTGSPSTPRPSRSALVRG